MLVGSIVVASPIPALVSAFFLWRFGCGDLPWLRARKRGKGTWPPALLLSLWMEMQAKASSSSHRDDVEVEG